MLFGPKGPVQLFSLLCGVYIPPQGVTLLEGRCSPAHGLSRTATQLALSVCQKLMFEYFFIVGPEALAYSAGSCVEEGLGETFVGCHTDLET